MSQMRGTTILWSQFMAAAIGAVLTLQAATQYVAHKLGHQPQLGEAAYTLLGYPMYWPWQYWPWLYHFDYYAKAIFFQGSLIIYGGMFCVFMVLVLMSVNRARRNSRPDTYGSARWATKKDIRKAGLLADQGLVLGQAADRQRKLLRHDGPEHCFVFAPTRSGKGVGIVIPTLLGWQGSVIVYDMKRENWDITAGWRQQFSHVLRFDPTAPYSVRFNPLLEVRQGENEVRDAQNIADILVDPDGSKTQMNHWEKTGHSLLVGVILHVLYAEKEKNLNGVALFLSDPERTFQQTLNRMLYYPHYQGKPHPVVASTARELKNKSENELSGVLSTVLGFLGLYRDPLIARNTRVSDFAIADLVHAEYPVSLYIVIPPSDADRTKPLVRLMLNQIGRRLTESMGEPVGTEPATPEDENENAGEHTAGHPDKVTQAHAPTTDTATTAPDTETRIRKRHQLLMLLDEFPTLGRLSFFESELAYMAGYGIRALMIAQSLNQIEKAYGPNHAILDNSHIRVTYGTLDERTAKRISDMLGTATESRRQSNYAGHRLAPWLGHVMVSEQDSPRPLLTPGEVLQFPVDEALVMVGGYPPYRGRKLRYFKDERFAGRIRLACPNDADKQGQELVGLHPPIVWEKYPSLPPTVTDHHTGGAGQVSGADKANQASTTSVGESQASQAAADAAAVAAVPSAVRDDSIHLSEVDPRLVGERDLERVLSVPDPEIDRGRGDPAPGMPPDAEDGGEQQEQERLRRAQQLQRQRGVEMARGPDIGGMPL